MGEIYEKFKKFIESPEGQEYFKKVKAQKEWEDSWKKEKLSWFNSIGPEKRSYYIQKVIDKYSSESYKDRWYNRGCFPPEELYFWLFDYAYEYGKCWRALSEEVGPGYDSKFVFDDWKVILYNGQGSIVRISHVTDEDIKKGPDSYSQQWLGHEYDRDYYNTLSEEFS